MSPLRLRKNAGFTLVEVLIALAILAVGILAIMKMFPDALRQARVAAERTIVSELANGRLSQVRAAGAEQLLQAKPGYLDYATVKSTVATGSLYENYFTNVQRMRGASDVFLQRVTFSVKMPDGRNETFVTYVSKQ